MSEFSSSYHVRTEEAKAVAQTLRNAGYAGILFGPSGGWLTFVPYSGHRHPGSYSYDDDLVVALSGRLEKSVLHYFYAEDFGWGFSWSDAAGRRARFSCWWRPSALIESSDLDLNMLSEIVDVESNEHIFCQYDGSGGNEVSPAYQFAEALALPAFKWLSPDLAQNDTASLLEMGGRKVGRKPNLPGAHIALPPRMKIKLPKSELSAREAFSIIDPYFKEWQLFRIMGDGSLANDGRCHPNGKWSFCYLKESDVGIFIVGYLFGSGSIGFEVYEQPPREPESGDSISAALAEGWIDSVDAVMAVLRDRYGPETGGTDSFHPDLMTLAASGGMQLWTIERFSIEQSHRLCETIGVDSTTGKILLETSERHSASGPISARVRMDGGEWEDWPIG